MLLFKYGFILRQKIHVIKMGINKNTSDRDFCPKILKTRLK